ncbi:nuclear transport factor 2 family protein [Sphingomonas sp. IC4-52]|uniref:nuclear transport factor 2 family protein n=1 Tax=Sphingomonas sp. IC4-52 TaxID=2887202 RepID=UPI001D116FF6|nr:nuclear transport factor 2 family protein [Sphingomonas sp. IC4-52]MCC2980137.1 nuclear transport factor 2 family protein [Sphingomonas sp. IC4-52]
MILPLLLALQVTPVAPLPKGTALPPSASEEGQVIAPVQRLFDALAANDPAAILAEVRPDGRATAVVEKADGTTAVTTSDWPAFAAKLGKPGPKLAETFTGMPAIEIDGNIAMVWGSYTFTVDGKPSHCGTNHVDLVRDGGRWRINNITWTQRTTGCAQ